MEKLIKKFRNKEIYNLNCAEAIVYSANEHYNLGLTENCLKMSAGFGGGIFEKHLCGIVSGAVCVLGIIFKGRIIEDINLLEITVNEFKEEFRNNFDQIECSYLIDNYFTEEQGCNKMICTSAKILKNVIDKYIDTE